MKVECDGVLVAFVGDKVGLVVVGDKVGLVVVGDKVGLVFLTQVPQASRQLSLALVLSVPTFLQRLGFVCTQSQSLKLSVDFLNLQVSLSVHEHVSQAIGQLTFAFVLSVPFTDLQRLGQGFLAIQLQSFPPFFFQSERSIHGLP